jgi:isoleucyl-tRNA synthetase
MVMSDSPAESPWKDTIFLPVTPFPMRGDLPQREPATVARWREMGLYQRMQDHRRHAAPFILHDGPPYANGDIHHGHALNKILKDIVVKFQTLAGRRAPFIPGWDCHGLPIEQKVDEQLGARKRDLDVVAFRQACRDYAAGWVDVQAESFRRLLVTADFEHPYRTMDPAYVASILRQLGVLMDRGYVYKGLKPVHWSWAAVTALAEAEVEYAPYDAPSVYVKFAMPAPPAWLAEAAGGRPVSVVIWTTTPWTLPSNVAIALHPDLDYQLLALPTGDAIVVADGLREATLQACGIEGATELAAFQGRALVGEGPADWPRLACRHPFVDRDSLLVAADYVTLEQGTGCVHTAPGHGQDDFQTGLRYGLPVLAPVNQFGKYTADVPDYQGQHVFAANPLIARRLHESGHLLNRPDDVYRVDRYPHCWRTRKPLIFRATEQWFVRVDHEGMRQKALDAIGRTRWIPSWGENRIRSMMEGRPDWCISRQRAWGVPIPAFRCSACGTDVVQGDHARHVASLVERAGSTDVWFQQDPASLAAPAAGCPSCGASPDRWEKVQDILDVWFDSGVSWAAVLQDREGIEGPADLYLEGSDQHRGWFHTSLLAAIGTRGDAPYRAVLTHGFVVDDQGRKYAKSSPRYEPLARMLENHGADVLRLWVSMVDYRGDMVLAPDLLKQAGGTYRKIRNTVRYLLGCVSDWTPNGASDSAEATPSALDRWVRVEVAQSLHRIRGHYEACEFSQAQTALFDLCNDTLSAVYLDALKDSLYCDAADDPLRRLRQALLLDIAESLLVAMAPILPFTADEAWQALPPREGRADHVLLADWPAWTLTPDDEAAHERVTSLWLEVRAATAQHIDALRPAKKGERLPGQLRSSQEAVVTLTVPADAVPAPEAGRSELAELLIVSDVQVVAGVPAEGRPFEVQVRPADAPRCERCWNHRAEVGTILTHPTLCRRCHQVVVRLPAAPTPA